MRYKKFQSTGIEVSELAVGTWAMGVRNYGKIDRGDSVKAIRTMLENGVNLIDTAPVYGNGASEMIVGEAIAGLDRSKLHILTKFGMRTDYTMPNYVKDSSFSNIIREVQSSLINLNTDYIDIYMLHYPDIGTHISETMCALGYLREKGCIRAVGVSNFTLEQIEQAKKYGKIDVLQLSYAMVNRTNETLFQWAHANGIDNMSYGSLGSGILSGRIRTNPGYNKTDIRSTFYDYFQEPKFSRIMKLLWKMDELALAHNRTVAQVALNWSAQKEFMSTILVGVRNQSEAVENCKAFDWRLSGDEIALLDQALNELEL